MSLFPQAICQQLVTRQEKMEMIQSLAADVVLLPSDGAEKKELEKELQSLFTEWDSICQQVTPHTVTPSHPHTLTPTSKKRKAI